MPSDQKWSGGIIDVETYLKWKWTSDYVGCKSQNPFFKITIQ
jgi:hypothetical protein